VPAEAHPIACKDAISQPSTNNVYHNSPVMSARNQHGKIQKSEHFPRHVSIVIVLPMRLSRKATEAVSAFSRSWPRECCRRTSAARRVCAWSSCPCPRPRRSGSSRNRTVCRSRTSRALSPAGHLGGERDARAEEDRLRVGRCGHGDAARRCVLEVLGGRVHGRQEQGGGTRR
jgi:hypothetical protein